MPFATIADQRAYYRFDGADEAPILILSHSLGLDHAMWDEQVSDLHAHLRLLRYDTRGHGASSVVSGDYSVASLAQDVLRLADALGIGRFAFCGLSLGGMIGQWLGVHAADRVTQLVIANTSPKPDATLMEQRRQAVLARWHDLHRHRWDGTLLLPGRAEERIPPGSHGPGGHCWRPIPWATPAAVPRFATGTGTGHCATFGSLLVIAGDIDVPMPWDDTAPCSPGIYPAFASSAFRPRICRISSGPVRSAPRWPISSSRR